MHLCAAGGSQQQPPGAATTGGIHGKTFETVRAQASAGKDNSRCSAEATSDLCTRISVTATPAQPVASASPLGCHARPVPNVVELGGEQVRCGQHVIHLLGRGGGPAIAQHRQAPVGTASDLTGVKQHHPCSRNIGVRATLSAVGCVQSRQSTRCLTPRAVGHGAIERAIFASCTH